jgi:Acetyltransferase (isoleucine patch superfamily)
VWSVAVPIIFQKMTHSKEWYDTWKRPQPVHNKLTPWHWLAVYPERLDIGMYVDIGSFTYIQAQEGITIEVEVQIGSHCSLYTVNTIDDTRGPIHLKHNCKIGTHSTILPGVTIGENSVVGAYSLVKRDVGDNVVVVGVPANIIQRIYEI